MFAGSPAPIGTLLPTVTPGDSTPADARFNGAQFGEASGGGARFAAALAAMTDGVAGAVGAADHSAAMLAAGNGDVAAAAIARAKADVALEIASVAASRVNAAMTALLQTQS
jgi:flagellar hook-basal body complex protein FliE